ncbi:putative membrane-bound dehydrogenase domain-containing protein [Cyclobacterium lianum]|uniref:Putative membrane-bound dehydrogenase domain-containing protein n=1 Tax=Cyclobacterium lianum TaxID=388280 RepID=A0A1M7L9L4_9BACT|nr:PVC-type heme-binding CxxCH protein [Cyclobacterium lianum]SHM74797.1 putative membrane-bound dehydrogenase domain-containing protein [Cyclobacterium lianum]
MFLALALLATLSFLNTSCQEKKIEHPLAANEDVARYMENFEGRGDLTDTGSAPTAPRDAVAEFQLPDDLEIELVLGEPSIVQPIHMSFDQRGRLWVVQYQQYPYPEGLKITSMDNHTRVTFDKQPEAPPAGARGADKISVFEDTNGDGHFDKSFDAITGLNITTSVALGRDRIWVLNPPYLLAFPDSNGDGLPEADPEVHLEGFGMEDTHAVANSLHWGPDGWLYGVQGSTTTSTIRAKNSRPVAFQGQAIWRYHPEKQTFELFAEGGGNNPFYLEFDRKGRIFSGSNGYGRGPYYKQGAYYVKSWGKHGALTNPYAFGHLPNMSLTGENKRFTHAVMMYEADLLPPKYRGMMMALNPLHHYIQLTELEASGSSFENTDTDLLLETGDRWFRPVDIKTGPDGAVYIADWYDSRLSHVDPRDTWHKSSGRIYRIKPKGQPTQSDSFDLTNANFSELATWLQHPNKWYRQQALRQFADRRSPGALPELYALFESENAQHALEALWAIHLSGGFEGDFVEKALQHADPFVQLWSIRLLGDRGSIPTEIFPIFMEVVAESFFPEMISQIASTAKRLPADQALPVLDGLLQLDLDPDDPDIGLLIWWALESKVDKNLPEVLAWWDKPATWQNPVSRKYLAARMMKRLVMDARYDAAWEVLKKSPGRSFDELLVNGFYEGMAGRDLTDIPKKLLAEISLKEELSEPLIMEMRAGDLTRLPDALNWLRDENQPLKKRMELVAILGEMRPANAPPVLFELIRSGNSPGALKQAAIHELKKFDDPNIGKTMASIYPAIRADDYVREAAIRLFSSRSIWAEAFFHEITDTRVIHKTDVPNHLISNFYALQSDSITDQMIKIWPESAPLEPTEINERINHWKEVVAKGSGNALAGKGIFVSSCGACHRMGATGGEVGPDLTGYERTNLDYWLLHTIDPNAAIREGYETMEITLLDGRKITGKLLHDEAGVKYIVPPMGGKGEHVPDDDIRDIQVSKKSTMPERIFDKLSEKDVRDLLAFILNS